MAALRKTIGVIAIVACAIFVYTVFQKRAFVQDLRTVQDRYADAKSEKDFQECAKLYEGLLDKAPSGDPKRICEGGVASCAAWVSYLDTTGKPSIEKYRGAIKLMEKAKELTGDTQGVWTRKIVVFKKRLKETIGPSPQDMGAQFAAMMKKPFTKTRRAMEDLYFWRFTWKQQKRNQGNPAYEAVFEKARKQMAKDYTVLLREVIAEVRKGPQRKPGQGKLTQEDELIFKSRPLGMLRNVQRHDREGLVAQLEKQYAKELTEARAAQKKLEEMMGP